MEVSRRELIGIGAGMALVGAAFPILRATADLRAPNVSAAPEIQDEKFIATVCAMCPSGCGLSVRVVNGHAVKVAGNPLHPLNQGVCCPKGQASLEALYSPERLAQPMRRKASKDIAANDLSQWEPIAWDDALKIVSDKLRTLRDQGQAHTVAVLHGELRGQMRPLWSRFLAAYGSPNMLSTDSLDGEAARLAMFFSQGINGYPIYDIDNARYVMCFGGSLLESSRHLQKYLSGYGFMHRGASNRAKLIVADSRLNVTAAKCDEWIPIRPGTTGALALGMAHVLIKSGLIDKSFVDKWTFGYEDFKDDQGRTHRGFKNFVLEEYSIDRVADMTGVPSGTIAKLAGEFGSNRPALAIMPTGRGDLAGGNGLYSALAIHALNALVGSIDVPGGVQVQQMPNLAQLPALLGDAVTEKSRTMARLDGAGSDYPVSYSAFQNLADNLVNGKPYTANALFLLNANPVHDAPQGKRFIDVFKKTPLVVSFSPVLDESAAYADLILPSLTFLEMWGDDILEATGFPGIGLRQPVVKPLRDGRNPGDVVLQLAKRLGGKVSEALPWDDFLALIKERIAGMQISWDDLVEKGTWSALVYNFAQPGSKAWASVVGRDRLNAPKDGRFDFFSRELFAALTPKDDTECLPHFTVPAQTADADYPFVMISQETMTQPRGWSGVIPTLEEVYGLQMSARWESWVEIHPKAAEQLQIRQDDWVWVESMAGKIRVRAKITEGIWHNAVNVPSGLGHYSAAQWGRESSTAKNTIGANPYDLLASASEKNSGVAASVPTRVKIYKG